MACRPVGVHFTPKKSQFVQNEVRQFSEKKPLTFEKGVMFKQDYTVWYPKSQPKTVYIFAFTDAPHTTVNAIFVPRGYNILNGLQIV